MSSTTHPVGDYRFSKDDRLLFDANVWLLLYGPQYNPGDWRVRAYSAATRCILNAKCSIFIDVLILSEFVNRWARFRFDTLDKLYRPHKFKEFRKSPEFQKVAQDTVVACRKIAAISNPIDDGFESMSISDLLADYETGEFDINDQVLASLCKTRELKLVTDDADFAQQNITILTANQRLLHR